MHNFARLPDVILEPMVLNAIMEDLGVAGDVTTRAVLPENTQYRAELKARQDAIVSGMQVAALTFRLMDPTLKIEMVVADGSACKAGDTLMRVEGLASSILAAERVALNFAGRLSGTATLTAAYAQTLEGTGGRQLDGAPATIEVIEDMAEAVRRINGQMKTEASGNVRIDRLQEIADTGVDYISSGALTHSAGTVDLGLDF